MEALSKPTTNFQKFVLATCRGDRLPRYRMGSVFELALAQDSCIVPVCVPACFSHHFSHWSQKDFRNSDRVLEISLSITRGAAYSPLPYNQIQDRLKTPSACSSIPIGTRSIDSLTWPATATLGLKKSHQVIRDPLHGFAHEVLGYSLAPLQYLLAPASSFMQCSFWMVERHDVLSGTNKNNAEPKLEPETLCKYCSHMLLSPARVYS